MNTGKYILKNGSFVNTDDYRITLAESQGTLFSEKFRAVRTAVPFFRETFDLIKLKLLIFNQSFPEFTENDGAGLKRQLERTLTKNKQFLGAVLTLSVSFFDEKLNYTICSEKFPTAGYELNEKGIYAGIFNKIQKPASALSNLSLGSEVFWNISAHHLHEGQSDCFLMVNTHDQIVETPRANVYLVKGKQIRGASVGQGAYRDVTGPVMMRLFKDLNLEYSENEGITIQDIKEAEEIFTVNAIEGIRWIVGFEGKRFFNNTIRKISEAFNQRLIQ